MYFYNAIYCIIATVFFLLFSSFAFYDCSANSFDEQFVICSFDHCILTTLSFRKFKVALNPMYRIFLNFAKSCVLSCLSKVDNIKKFHRAVIEL